MSKANISFPKGMLEEIDRRAVAAGTTRSGFVQEAAARYLAELDSAAEHELRAHRIEDAKRRMAVIGAALPEGDQGVTLIRGMRDALPEWAAKRSECDR